MKHILRLFTIVCLANLFFQQCANPGRPTGGPKDTIPPVLLNSSPITGTTNFSENIIELEFSEFVNADKLKQELIITPKSDIRYKSIVKRNKLIIKIEDELLDSTTYNFNFANGVTDITEKNPVVNLSLAFSTGPFIDSMSIEGEVEQLLTQTPGADFVVSLYPYSDSLDYFTDQPLYFTTASDSGKFRMEYLKKSDYKILAFQDLNKNFLLDAESETHAFLSDIIKLDSLVVTRKMRSVLQNVKPLKLINTRPTGRYVEIKFNKLIDSYSIKPENVYHNIIGDDRDVIRLYKSEQVNYADSITSFLFASDSLGNEVNDTIKYVFLESNRRPSGFSYTILNDPQLVDTPRVRINFNKPIKDFYPDSIRIESDSIFAINPSKTFTWNFNKTKLDLQLEFITDSLYNQFLRSIPKDTITTDSLQEELPINAANHQLQMIIPKGTFISVESDTSKTKKPYIRKPVVESYGTLKLDLTTEVESFIFQLLDKSGKVKYEKQNDLKPTFSEVRPGNYDIRILIDNNLDGEWSFGNLLQNEEPEEVFLYEEEISIRENWVIELSITF